MRHSPKARTYNRQCASSEKAAAAGNIDRAVEAGRAVAAKPPLSHRGVAIQAAARLLCELVGAAVEMLTGLIINKRPQSSWLRDEISDFAHRTNAAEPVTSLARPAPKLGIVEGRAWQQRHINNRTWRKRHQYAKGARLAIISPIAVTTTQQPPAQRNDRLY